MVFSQVCKTTLDFGDLMLIEVGSPLNFQPVGGFGEQWLWPFVTSAKKTLIALFGP